MVQAFNLPRHHANCLRCVFFAAAGVVAIAGGCVLALYPFFSHVVNAWLANREMLVFQNVLSSLKILPIVLDGLALIFTGAVLIVSSRLAASRAVELRQPLVLTVRILLACAVLTAVGSLLL